MWIILSNALDDFGIREVNDVTRTGTSEKLLPQHVQIEEKKRKVMNEALHGALRIAGLVSPANSVRPSMAVKAHVWMVSDVHRLAFWPQTDTWYAFSPTSPIYP